MTDPLQDPGVSGLAQLGRNAIERVAQLEADLAASVAKRDEWVGFSAVLSSRLGNLLAVIHRDGGHYESEHGTEKACADAETAVHVLRGSLEGYVEANRYMKGELEDALEDARKYSEAQKEIARLTDANRKYAKALTEHQGSIDWREWMLVPVTECEFIPKAKQEAEIARLREALAAIVNRCDGSAVRIARAALANGGGE